MLPEFKNLSSKAYFVLHSCTIVNANRSCCKNTSTFSSFDTCSAQMSSRASASTKHFTDKFTCISQLQNITLPYHFVVSGVSHTLPPRKGLGTAGITAVVPLNATGARGNQSILLYLFYAVVSCHGGCYFSLCNWSPGATEASSSNLFYAVVSCCLLPFMQLEPRANEPRLLLYLFNAVVRL